MLEVVAIFQPELRHEVDDLRSGVGNLDGVGLDVHDRESLFLHCCLEIDHEECATLGYNIVDVSWIAEWVIEARGREAVNDVDDDLECIRERFSVILLCEIGNENTSEETASGFVILSLDCDSSCLESCVISGVRAEKIEQARWK